jgi:hypothetical protein
MLQAGRSLVRFPNFTVPLLQFIVAFVYDEVIATEPVPSHDRCMVSYFVVPSPMITSILTTDSDPAVASHLLQTGLLAIQNWLKRWRMKVNETKSTHVIFTRRVTCPPVKISDVQLPQSDEVKYLDLHLDRRLTWHKHIFHQEETTRPYPNQNALAARTKVPTLHHQQTILLYKTILKPIWTYGIQL